MRERAGKKNKWTSEKTAFFRRLVIVWGLIAAVLFGALGAIFGSIDGARGAMLFGVLGAIVGFGLGVLLQSVERLPPREGTYLSKGNYIGGNRMPDIDDPQDSKKSK